MVSDLHNGVVPRTRAMHSTFTLQFQSMHIHEGVAARVLPTGRVRLLGKPRVGECLVIVGEDGVVQTSSVRGWLASDTGVVVETANSRYILRNATAASF